MELKEAQETHLSEFEAFRSVFPHNLEPQNHVHSAALAGPRKTLLAPFARDSGETSAQRRFSWKSFVS